MNSPAASQATGERHRLVSATVEKWANDLIDRTGKNRLLHLKPAQRSVLLLDDAEPGAVEQLIEGHKVKLSELFRVVEQRKVAAGSARTIEKRARQAFDEWGFSPLHLVLHTATWPAASDRPTPCAPVFLCPIRLSALSGGADFALEAEPAWEINEALRLVLAERHDLHLEPADFAPGLVGVPDPEAALDEFRKRLADTPAVSADPLLAVANLEYNNLPMARDLKNQVEELAKSDLIARLVGERPTPGGTVPSGAGRSATDRPAVAPGSELLILKADSSQTEVVQKVLAGRNVVIEGPPGTGKSQTIANLIGALVGEGRSVLFVAEKRAAIDAVSTHLKKKNLGDLLFDLHSGVASRREVKQRLQEALDTPSEVPEPDVGLDDDLYARVKRQLDAASETLHTVHPEWGVSMGQAMERFLRLSPAERPEVQPARRIAPVHVTELSNLTVAMKEFVDGDLGIRLLRSGSAWSRELSRTTITSHEEAAAIRDALADLAGYLLPEFGSSSEALLREVGATGPGTLGGWNDLFVLLDEVEQALLRFEPDAFSRDLDKLGTTLSTSNALSRRLSGRHREAERVARSLVRDAADLSTSDVADLVNRTATTTRRWRRSAPDRPFPSTPPDSQRCRKLWREISRLADQLSAVLDRDLHDDDLSSAADLVERLLDDEELLLALPRLRLHWQRLTRAGFEPLLRQYVDGTRDTDSAAKDVEHLWAAAVVEQLRPQEARESRSRGTLDEATQVFQERDQRYIDSAKDRIRRRWAERVHGLRTQLPDQYQNLVRASRRTGVASSHLRTLLDGSTDVLLGLLPCWVMSPLVVSKLLPASYGLFDVVIFDEASQVKPVHAIPTLLRGRQVVVAGDDKQLPPGNLFNVNPDDDPDDEEDDLTSGVESLLDLMASIPNDVERVQLLWHYRSRDERLIAFCNQREELYRGRLNTIPGVVQDAPIEHVRVPGPTNDRPVSPQAELDQVLNLVLAHLDEHPEESLGIIALSSRHAERIENALSTAERDHPDLARWRGLEDEPLFVKHIETVQGDERDRIIISVGLGHQPNGRLHNLLGLINHEPGVRRLNVAFTRARNHITIITSFDARELSRFPRPGPKMLQSYLDYIAGGCIPATVSARTNKARLNGFEQDVQRALDEQSIPHACQYGVSGLSLDFALLHPERPGRFVLAVECDGEQYHATRTARDRDRLRQEHFEQLGWRFHRIWYTEWFRHRDAEFRELLHAYRVAVEDADLESGHRKRPRFPTPTPQPADPEPPSMMSTRGRRPQVPKHRRIGQYQPEEIEKIVRWVKSDTLLRTREPLVREVALQLGFNRTGSQIRSAIERAVDAVDADQDSAPRPARPRRPDHSSGSEL